MDIITCMERTHHLFVLMISTKGLHRGFITQGRYRRLVYIAMSPFDIPMFVNIITDIVFTMKYGIPSAKYNVGIHNQGLFLLSINIRFIINLLGLNGLPDNNDGVSACRYGLPLPSLPLRSDTVPLRDPIQNQEALQ